MFSKILKGSVPEGEGEFGGYEVKNQCQGCRWFHPWTGTSCDTFQKGIPLPILLGAFDHTVPWDPEDDNELVFIAK